MGEDLILVINLTEVEIGTNKRIQFGVLEVFLFWFGLVSCLVWVFWFWVFFSPQETKYFLASKILLTKCFKGEIMQHTLHKQSTEVKRLMLNKD